MTHDDQTVGCPSCDCQYCVLCGGKQVPLALVVEYHLLALNTLPTDNEAWHAWFSAVYALRERYGLKPPFDIPARYRRG